MVLCRMGQGAFVLEDLAQIAAINPAAARLASDEMLGFVLRRVADELAMYLPRGDAGYLPQSSSASRFTAGASNQACGPVGRRSIIHKNKTPQIAGSCHSAHRTAGDRGIGAIRTRLMNVSRASFGEVQRSLAELRVMHRWRTELFRHLVHSLEVDLCVAEQRQIDLSAHRGHVGLRPLRIEPSDPCPTRHPKR